MRRHPLHSQRRGRCQKISGSKWFPGIPSIAKEEGDVKKSADPNGFHAPNTDGKLHEKGSFHHCCQMVWHGSLDGSLLMKQGGAHARTSPYYFSRISFTQKIPGNLLFIHRSLSMRKSRTSHYASDGPKESWQRHWGCQRRWCIVGLLIRLYEFIPTL